MEPVNADDLAWSETERGDAHFRRKKLAPAAGGEELGASLYELPPGAEGWPLHHHTANEEAFYVLAGEGELRTGGADDGGPYALEPGDYVACPADERGTHQLRATGEEPLRYLAVSTMRAPDVTVYPDSETVGVFTGRPPGGEGERPVSGFFRLDDAVDYWAVNTGDAAGDDGAAASDESNREP
ncbi:MAG: cupin domain-containing protein [Haloglomus sp.]